MRNINFPLNNPVRLTPVSGTTTVSVQTTGDVLVTEATESKTHHERAIVMADSGKGTLSRSPKGLNRTVKITLPLQEASESEFHRQVDKLFEIVRLGSV